jgi:hypothetical protein
MFARSDAVHRDMLTDEVEIKLNGLHFFAVVLKKDQ